MSQPKRRPSEEELLAKIRRLPPERVAEVEDFVDFLRQRDEEQQLTQRREPALRGRLRQGLGRPRRRRL